MEDHVDVTVTTEHRSKAKTTRAVDARRQIFSGGVAGEYMTL